MADPSAESNPGSDPEAASVMAPEVGSGSGESKAKRLSDRRKVSLDASAVRLPPEEATAVSEPVKDSAAVLAAPPQNTDVLNPHSVAAKSSSFMIPNSPEKRHCCYQRRFVIFAIVIFVTGLGVSLAFLSLGITSANHDGTLQFQKSADEVILSVQSAWHDFEVAGLWIHDSCRETADQFDTFGDRGICSRDNFDQLYEYLLSSGLQFQAASWVMNVSHTERLDLEQESRNYYAEHLPDFNYTGFTGFQPDPDAPNGVSLHPRGVHPFYTPAHYILPLEGRNIAALDFDLQTSKIRREALQAAYETFQPSLTERLLLVADVETFGLRYSVILMHPGVPLQAYPDNFRPKSFALIVVEVNELLTRAMAGHSVSKAVYLYDATGSDVPANNPVFLGGVIKFDGAVDEVVDAAETPLANLQGARYYVQDSITIGDKHWIVAVTTVDDTYRPNLVFVILGGVIIFVACLCLAIWYYTSSRRELKMNELQAAAESEKAALILENANQAAQAERELNDFLAHEVRNPLAAAISACSFVSAEVQAPEPMNNEESKLSVRDDVTVIGNSLQFINDLLRNMLDMHRAACNQLKIELAPTDLLRDVLEPVSSMIHRRGDPYQVQVECEPNIVVMTDRMRLKQVVLNLAGNARKFVDRGFIRLEAVVLDNGMVRIHVDDSGPGIPMEKRDQLFVKFQKSLDSLNQGTGIGLSLSKKLMLLMKGDIFVEDGYNSGIEGCPGTRMVIDLRTPPLEMDADDLDRLEQSFHPGSNRNLLDAAEDDKDDSKLEELPDHLSALFVDDDLVLRKLFQRCVIRIAPQWDIQEASNGETAIRLAEANKFDLIFIDQYMASVEKQLLGSETVRALRANGCDAIICGLSANDQKDLFLQAGADAFMFKPFPCEESALRWELERMLSRSHSESHDKEENEGVLPGGSE